MQNEYDRETKEKGLCKPPATTEGPATSTGDATTTESAAAATTTSTEATAAIVGTETAATTTQAEGMVAEPQDPLSPCADASFFKVGVGFLAWALWGHIPLNDGAQMVSKLFSNAKANTSYGRGTSTRSAMQNAVIAASAAPVDNRRGRGKKRDNNILNTNVQPAGPASDAAELALLNKTLKHLSDEPIKRKRRRSIVCVFVSFVISSLHVEDAAKSFFKG
jgi:hypothetical protein